MISVKMTWCHCAGCGHCTLYSQVLGKNMEKGVFEVWPEDIRRRCRSDLLWQTVPYDRSANQKGSVVNSR